jgi:predicted CXXCH cytochrome family protein
MNSTRVVLVSLLAAGILGVVAAWGGSRPATADNGPHQMGDGSAAATDRCAGCHRAHTAKGKDFLFVQGAASVQAFCFTCHNGVGADTNVVDGVLMATRGDPGVVTPGVALKGGGFESAAIDTSANGVTEPIGALAVPEPATSVHSTGGTGLTAWGNGPIDGTPAGNPGFANFGLECTSCHDPHGNGNYRILRPLPADHGGAVDNNPAGVVIADPVAKVYDTDDYGVQAVQQRLPLTQWCSQCHTRYLANTGDPTATASGDTIFMYRHPTGQFGVYCASCHVAHGTNAKGDGTYTSVVELPGGTAWTADPALPGSQNSRLLKVDYRGVCLQCHAVE